MTIFNLINMAYYGTLRNKQAIKYWLWLLVAEHHLTSIIYKSKLTVNNNSYTTSMSGWMEKKGNNINFIWFLVKKTLSYVLCPTTQLAVKLV